MRVEESHPSSRLEVALTQEWCMTHYHSPEWWQHRYRPRPDYDPRIDWPERYTDGPI